MILTKISGVGLIILSYLFTYNTLPKVGYFWNTLFFIIYIYFSCTVESTQPPEAKPVGDQSYRCSKSYNSRPVWLHNNGKLIIYMSFTLFIFQPLDEWQWKSRKYIKWLRFPDGKHLHHGYVAVITPPVCSITSWSMGSTRWWRSGSWRSSDLYSGWMIKYYNT